MTGIREWNAALRKADAKTRKINRDSAKQVAAPVVKGAQARIGRYPGAKLNTIRPKSTAAAIRVEQGARKVTGHRGDYGQLQQRRLDEALDASTAEVIRGYELHLDRMIAAAGL